MELSSCNIKTILIFLEIELSSLIFLPYVSGRNFPGSKPALKKISYISKNGTYQLQD